MTTRPGRSVNDHDSPFARADLPDLTLQPLSADSAAALLNAYAPDLALPTRARVLAAAAGNPLAIIELSRSRQDPGGPTARSRPAAADDAPRASVRLTARWAAAAHAAPARRGSGERLFDGVDDPGLVPVEATHSPWATYIRYRVGR